MKDWDDIIQILGKDYLKDINVTQEVLADIKKYPWLYQNSPVKVQMGMIYTNQEYSKRRDEILAKPLPGEKKPVILQKIKRRAKN